MDRRPVALALDALRLLPWATLILIALARMTVTAPGPYLAYLLFIPGSALCLPLLLMVATRVRRRSRGAARAVGLGAAALAYLFTGFHWSFADEPAVSPYRLRVVTANLHGWSADLIPSGEKLSRCDADVYLLQEIWSPLQLEKVAAALPNHRFLMASGSLPAGNFEYGVFIAIKAPLRPVLSRSFPNGLAVEADCPAGRLSFVSIHGRKSSKFWPSDLERTLGLQAEQTHEIKDWLAEVRIPTIVGGDLNGPPEAPMAKALRADLLDAFGQSGRGLSYTFPAAFPLIRIDQVLATTPWVATGYSTRDIGSDHKAIQVDYSLRQDPGVHR